MRKSKLIIEKRIFNKLMKEYLKAKLEEKEDKYISKMALQNPRLAAAFKGMDDAMLKKALGFLQLFKKYNLDTKEVEKYLKTHYIKV